MENKPPFGPMLRRPAEEFPVVGARKKSSSAAFMQDLKKMHPRGRRKFFPRHRAALLLSAFLGNPRRNLVGNSEPCKRF